MPGVASTGIVLMSQRVFFAYEDAKPVFLMGIVPTILQIIVGWSIYFATGVRWWVIGAALGETVCRIVQGLIAMRWVGQRNSYVNSSEITRSYLTYVGCAIIAGGIGFGALGNLHDPVLKDPALAAFGCEVWRGGHHRHRRVHDRNASDQSSRIFNQYSSPAQAFTPSDRGM